MAAKSDVILINLGRLAAVYEHPLTLDGIDGYTGALHDLTSTELQHGFTRAIRELKWWPKPSELREMCTGRAACMTDKLRVDQAWAWLQWYIEMFGVPALDRWLIQGLVFNGESPDSAVRGSKSPVTLAITAPFYEIEVTAVPYIPDLVRETLIAMSGSVEMGLTRIKEAIRIRKGAEDCFGKDSAFARKDWDEYGNRAIAAARIPSASHVNPALQLTGDVAPEFAVPQPKAIAVRIKPDSNGYKFRPLTFEEATALNLAGKLPQHLYEDALQRHLAREARQKILDTPEDFNAVYLEEFFPLQLRGEPEPYRMGRFAVESADGAMIIRNSLAMGVGDMQLTKGKVIRFTAKRNDLRYEEYQRFYFDLQSMTVRAE